MKKILSIFLLLLLLFPSYVKVKADDEEIIVSGSLRCPVSENGKSCIETKVNGIVTKTETTIQSENIKVIKVVETTNEIGTYKVYFKVFGDSNNIQPSKQDVDIVLVLDASTTVTYYYNNNGSIPKAAKFFAEKFSSYSNVYLAAIKFNYKAEVLRGLDNKNFNSVDFGRVAVNSRINLGIREAESLLNDSSKNSYVVILGDGNYVTSNLDETINIASRLRSKGTTIYIIGYSEGTSGKYKNNLIKIAGSEERYYASEDLNNIKNEFEKIANEISGEIGTSGNITKAYLTDKLGASFTIKDSLQNEKTMTITNIGKEGVATEPFYIKIEEYSETGWYSTNDGFTLSYTDKNNNNRELKSSVNPEVYWIQMRTTVNACSGDANLNSIKTGSVDYIDNYYETICEEGYIENNTTYTGYKASFKVNDLSDNQYFIDPVTKKEYFYIKSGLGFPSTISISTNVRCTYTFKVNEFNEAYQEIDRKIKNTTDAFELASLSKKKEELDNLIINYSEMQKNDLKLYQDRFINQSAKLTIKYGNETKFANFINEGTPSTPINCQNNSESIVNNQKIISNMVCYANFSKDMTLENTCLDMTTGEKSSCTGNNYIYGGNKIYTDLNKNEGQIYIEMKKATLNEKVDIKLEDCDVKMTPMNIQYRQIENNDPFLKNYTNNQREIGRNYSNDKYNFVNIIKSNIWENNNFYYRFSLSKIDVHNINQDTNNLGNNKYLGNDCYINANRKYVCELLRNTDEYGNYFTNIEVNNDKIS